MQLDFILKSLRKDPQDSYGSASGHSPRIHVGITQAQFSSLAEEFLSTARHPRFGVSYMQTVYTPMLELIRFLKINGFKVYISTGGSMPFVRVFSEKIYGVPRENVIGNSVRYKYVVRNRVPLLIRQSGFIEPMNEGKGKPVNIELHIGRRPIFACGNSDGDLEMLEYADYGKAPRLLLVVHHNDAEREYRYEEGAENILRVAAQRNWTLVNMKSDFKITFPFQQ